MKDPKTETKNTAKQSAKKKLTKCHGSGTSYINFLCFIEYFCMSSIKTRIAMHKIIIRRDNKIG